MPQYFQKLSDASRRRGVSLVSTACVVSSSKLAWPCGSQICVQTQSCLSMWLIMVLQVILSSAHIEMNAVNQTSDWSWLIYMIQEIEMYNCLTFIQSCTFIWLKSDVQSCLPINHFPPKYNKSAADIYVHWNIYRQKYRKSL